MLPKRINRIVSITHDTDGWDVIDIHGEGQSPTLSKKIKNLKGFTYDIRSRSLEWMYTSSSGCAF